MEKSLAATLKKFGRKLRMFLDFADTPLSIPQKSGLSVLNTLLLFDTVSRGTASQPQGAWQGNEEWISRRTVDALKDDLRAKNQEKGHKRFIANHFQKVELKVFFSMDSISSESPCLFWGVIFKKQNKTNLHSSTFKIIFCFTSVWNAHTENGTNGTRYQSENKLSFPINLLSNLSPIPQGVAFSKICKQRKSMFSPYPQPCHWPCCLVSPSPTQKGTAVPAPSPRLLHGVHPRPPPQTRLPNSLSVCFLIFSVTVSPAICSRWMASLSGLPLRLTLLMANIRSPTWMAPVLGRKGTIRNLREAICLCKTCH